MLRRTAPLLAAALAGAALAAPAAPGAVVRHEQGQPDPLAPAARPSHEHRRSAGERAAALALRQVGVPYAWGGTTPRGFDCSGLARYVWARVGVALPHSSFGQRAAGTPVERSALEPGDLVFFYGGSHVGVYVGGGRIVHAPGEGRSVEVVSLTLPWLERGYAGAVRPAASG